MSDGAYDTAAPAFLDEAALQAKAQGSLATAIHVPATRSDEDRMRNPAGDFIPYQIYRNAARSQVWGSGWGNAPWGIAFGLGRDSVTAYGRINTVPNGLSPGTYEDTVTVSITF